MVRKPEGDASRSQGGEGRPQGGEGRPQGGEGRPPARPVDRRPPRRFEKPAGEGGEKPEGGEFSVEKWVSVLIIMVEWTYFNTTHFRECSYIGADNDFWSPLLANSHSLTNCII